MNQLARTKTLIDSQYHGVVGHTLWDTEKNSNEFVFLVKIDFMALSDYADVCSPAQYAFIA